MLQRWKKQMNRSEGRRGSEKMKRPGGLGKSRAKLDHRQPAPYRRSQALGRRLKGVPKAKERGKRVKGGGTWTLPVLPLAWPSRRNGTKRQRLKRPKGARKKARTRQQRPHCLPGIGGGSPEKGPLVNGYRRLRPTRGRRPRTGAGKGTTPGFPARGASGSFTKARKRPTPPPGIQESRPGRTATSPPP